MIKFVQKYTGNKNSSFCTGRNETSFVLSSDPTAMYTGTFLFNLINLQVMYRYVADNYIYVRTVPYITYLLTSPPPSPPRVEGGACCHALAASVTWGGGVRRFLLPPMLNISPILPPSPPPPGRYSTMLQ